MKIKAIRYPTTLDKIEDITNDNIDVFVDLEDGFTCTIVVSTAKNIEMYMKENGYSTPGWVQQLIVVEKLEETLIRKAIEAYAEDDAYWLKVTFLVTGLDKEYLQDKMERINLSNQKLLNGEV
ncbi:hypothetical protein I6N96_10890 [Enterococcus sp. BWM-S5]|uniref:Uncharacterized protein n=1 Tax=Enterococcus larvae TaxID=2794352 RepID=A0ABS4CJI2_9ENTE|nr:hypothetical protein [Enterococcus larvae]MBP1046772.1 hypothetical protein [Enterococcus larvae]